MNRVLYSPKIKFYQQSTDNQIQSGVSVIQVLESYKDLLRIKPYLEKNEQIQLEKIYEPWLAVPVRH